MVILGVAPGIKKLAYCVIEPVGDPTYPEWEILDIDKLKGARVAAAALAAYGAAELLKKFRVHDLILSTVWERYTPKVLVVGPPADPKESSRLLAAARSALRTMADSYDMVYIEIDSMEKLCEYLECGSVRGLRKAILDHLEYNIQTRDMCKVVAMASATAATIKKKPGELPEPDPVSARRPVSIFEYLRV